jgi:hypothetical protein
MANGDRSAVQSGIGRKPRAHSGKVVSGAAPKRPGRKPGKHSDENYTQTSIYLPVELRNRVRARLYERGMEMSGLVEDMLWDWLSGEMGT